MAEKVLVGMSGGVDSTVAASVLIEQGYIVAGVTLTLCEQENGQAVCDARAVCEKMGIEHYVLDLRQGFKELVIGDFITEYNKGNTPNPCIVCNKYIKFGAMLEYAKNLGFDKIATGHYARIEKDKTGKYQLLKAVDQAKDQSYVLYNLTNEKLEKVLFPLGNLTKAQVRERATNIGFINANRPDSQDICFVPDGDYAAFIEGVEGKKATVGDYVDINGKVLGKHKGIIHYTLGQRKGLGIALGKPQFVISKDSTTNQVVLGDEQHLFKNEVMVKNVSFIPFEKLEKNIEVTVKLRYRHIASKAVISPLEKDMVLVTFLEPQRAASSGQSAVFYDGERVIGGGIIA